MPDSVTKREWRELLRLAPPIAAAQAGTQLMGLVDVAVLGRVGARELAAAGLGNTLFFTVAIIGMGTVFGVDPLIGQAVGAGDRVHARRMLWQGVWLSLLVSVVLMMVMASVAFALPYAGVEAELVAPARAFLLIRMISVAPFLIYLVIRAYLQAHGVTRPMLTTMLAANVVNFGGDILLIFGGHALPAWCGPLRRIPALGVPGAALSTVFCNFLQLALLAAATRGVGTRERVSLRPDRAELAKAFRVGIPIGLQLGAEIGIFALVGILAARLGTRPLAAHQLVLSVASFTYTIALGVAAAGTVRVSIGVGARDPVATRTSGRVAFLAGAGIMTLAALTFALAPARVARLVTDQQAIIATAIPLFMVAAVFQLSDGIQAIGAGVLRGAGDTRFTMFANLLGHWLIGLPVALLLGFRAGLGVVGMWWGLCAGLSVVAVLLLVRFERLAAKTIVPL
jgi:multidrug resistance protein, MATE family